MERITVETLPPTDTEGGAVRWSLSEALDVERLALNRFRVEPGDRLSLSRHAHTDQEEVFVVLSGEATFETSDGAVTVGEREAIRFAPGEFKAGRNDGDRVLGLLALGAPRDGGEVHISWTPDRGEISCPACGHDAMRLAESGDGPPLACPNCETGWEPG